MADRGMREAEDVCGVPCWSAVVALLLSGCGPTNREVGAIILATTPVAVLVSLGLLRGLCALWRRADATLELRWKVQYILLGVTVLFALPFVTVFAGLFTNLDLLLMTLGFYGSSYLAVFLLVWRIWFAFDRAGSFRLANVAVTVLFALPALPLLGSTAEASDFVLGFYIFPGFYGVPTGILLLVVFLEPLVRAAVRGRRS